MQGLSSIERAGEQKRPSRSGLGDRPAIVGAILGLGLVQHPGITCCFLVEAKSSMGYPGERVEPLEAKKDKGEDIGDEIAGTMMCKLMVECQAAFVRGIELLEILGHGNYPVEDAERERTSHLGRPDNPN